MDCLDQVKWLKDNCKAYISKKVGRLPLLAGSYPDGDMWEMQYSNSTFVLLVYSDNRCKVDFLSLRMYDTPKLISEYQRLIQHITKSAVTRKRNCTNVTLKPKPTYIDIHNVMYEEIDGRNVVSEVFLKTMTPSQVRPIVRSHWTEVRTGEGVLDFRYQCENCKRLTPVGGYVTKPQFCPHCNAEMI